MGHTAAEPQSSPSEVTDAGPARTGGAMRADTEPGGLGDPYEAGRSARKRRAIMAAATTLFLRNGYQGTSMDEIAALAAVSKQTVYKNFADKERLFTDIVLGTLDQAGGPVIAQIRLLHDTVDLDKDLGELARRYLAGVMRPQVLQVRRLVIGEANRLPELARTYYERAPERALTALAACFEHLAGRGLLRAGDPLTAAGHFAFLILGRPLDKALFYRDDNMFTQAELDHLADAGVSVFLAAYGSS